MKPIVAFLVGGAVRDMLLGLDPKDSDYVVIGSTIEDMEALGFKQVGADFPVFLHPESGEEYALARSEKKTGPGYHGFQVEFSPNVTLEEDLMRRDLTINAMAIDANGVVVDPYGGMKDLDAKILRHTSDAFKEDPVRVLRLARFAARYSDFTIAPETMELMKGMVEAGELNTLTPERVFAEFEKGLMEGKPSRMFQILDTVGAGKQILPEFFEIWPGRYEALDVAAGREDSFEVRFAIIANGFKCEADYLKWRVTSDAKEVSTLVNNNYQTFVNYDTLTSSERIQLFNRCDLFRRKERFHKVLTASRLVMNYAQVPKEMSFEIITDMVNVEQVDGGKIAMSLTDKSKIKDEIFKARMEAIANA